MRVRSLPHWLAYWAIGWQMAAMRYRDMIVDICEKMFAIRPRIHLANRNPVNEYLETVWKRISTLTSSFVTTCQPESLQERFKSYVDAEEQRLREGLETVKYGIDAMDTLLLVTGPGRIEKVDTTRFRCSTRFANTTLTLVPLPTPVACSSPRFRDCPPVPKHSHPQI